MAAKSTNQFDKERWPRLAENWIKLAEQVDKRRPQLWRLSSEESEGELDMTPTHGPFRGRRPVEASRADHFWAFCRFVFGIPPLLVLSKRDRAAQAEGH